MLKKLRDYLASHPLYFLVLRKIIELNFRKEKKIIREVYSAAGPGKVLDIGCGTGEYSGCFHAGEYTGIDISEDYIKYAKKIKQGDFQVMDATKISFSSDSFDFILIAAILHHLTDEETGRVLAEARRVLKPSGKILIMEDAKIPSLDTSIVKFVQSFDIGEHIRNPEEYKKIFLSHFIIKREWQFRNGGCTYYAALMEK